MGRFKQGMRKRGIWLTHANAERVLAVMKRRALFVQMTDDDRELIDQFEKRVKEMR